MQFSITVSVLNDLFVQAEIVNVTDFLNKMPSFLALLLDITLRFDEQFDRRGVQPQSVDRLLQVPVSKARHGALVLDELDLDDVRPPPDGRLLLLAAVLLLSVPGIDLPTMRSC